MSTLNYQLAGSPFVILNACGTSIRDPSKTSDFVHEFMKCGGRGVIATECDVPDVFASEFIQHVYNRCLNGELFVRALFEARQYFLTAHRNPLGLLYSAYLPLESRLVKSALSFDLNELG
jgi:CHAT domain-containing protein